jgi:hypothetical protein
MIGRQQISKIGTQLNNALQVFTPDTIHEISCKSLMAKKVTLENQCYSQCQIQEHYTNKDFNNDTIYRDCVIYYGRLGEGRNVSLQVCMPNVATAAFPELFLVTEHFLTQ